MRHASFCHESDPTGALRFSMDNWQLAGKHRFCARARLRLCGKFREIDASFSPCGQKHFAASYILNKFLEQWLAAFSILVFTESMVSSGFFLKKKPPSMHS
jgi:hypothetical protein